MLKNLKTTLNSFIFPQKKLARWAGWFFGANAVLFWLIGLRYIFAITPLSLFITNAFSKFLVWLFIITGFIGHLALLAYLPCFCLILPLILLRLPKVFIFSLAILAATFSISLLFIDTIAFVQYRFHLNGILLSMLFSGNPQEIFALSAVEWWIAGVLISAFLLIEILLAWIVWRYIICKPFQLFGKTLSISLITCLITSYYLLILTSSSPWLSLSQQAFALPLYDNVMSKFLPVPNSLEALQALGQTNFIQPKQPNYTLRYPLHPLVCHPVSKPLNIVFIVIDTWRFDMLNSTVTPYLTNFSQQNLQFTQHVSGGNATLPGIFSLFYSIPATYWTAVSAQKIGPLFIDELLKQRYQLGIYASAQLNAPAFNKNVFSKVADLQVSSKGSNPYERDKFITSEFQHFLNQHTQPFQQPFFSFLFYDSAHSYCAPGNPIQRFKPAANRCNRFGLSERTNPALYINDYKNSVYYVDTLIQHDIEALKKQGLWNSTIVVITGDHGNEFNDNHLDYWGHGSNYTRYQVQTPLLIHWPGKPAQTITYQTTHYDIVPTLLNNVLNCQNSPTDYSLGNSLFTPTLKQYLLIASYIDIGIVQKNHITRIFPTGDYQVYDLHNHLLPAETLDKPILMRALNDMRKFYTVSPADITF